jgi:hypothetical protein
MKIQQYGVLFQKQGVFSSCIIYTVQFQAPSCVASRIMLPSHDLPTGFGVQHLWVCESSMSSLPSRISVVSLHTNKPCIVDSFAVSESATISAVESVPGWSTGSSDKFSFKEDTVWMAAGEKLVEPSHSSFIHLLMLWICQAYNFELANTIGVKCHRGWSATGRSFLWH